MRASSSAWTVCCKASQPTRLESRGTGTPPRRSNPARLLNSPDSHPRRGRPRGGRAWRGGPSTASVNHCRTSADHGTLTTPTRTCGTTARPGSTTKHPPVAR
jgi:hypothetical protein